MAGKGGGAGFQDCPLSLELDAEKTPWAAVFPLFGRLRRDASVEHMAGVRGSRRVATFFSSRSSGILSFCFPPFFYCRNVIYGLKVIIPFFSVLSNMKGCDESSIGACGNLWQFIPPLCRDIHNKPHD